MKRHSEIINHPEFGLVGVINLTKGQQTIVSLPDFEYLRQFNWQYFKAPNMKTGYVRRTIHIGKNKTKTIHMHQEILGTIPGMQSDHINTNGLDNRRENLRFATRSQNCCNRNLNIRNKSGVKGVRWDKRQKRWVVRVKSAGVYVFDKKFKDFEVAERAYQNAIKEFHGEFANVG